MTNKSKSQSQENSLVPQEPVSLDIALPDYLGGVLEGQESKEREKLPHAQVATPRTVLIEDVREHSWGFFIPKEQAEVACFEPDDNWNETVIVIPSQPINKKIDGYIATKLRMVFIYRSGIEIQKRSFDGTSWDFLGEGYLKGKKTEACLLADKDTSNPKIYRYRTRNIVLFLDENNQPLSTSPFTLGFGKGVGVTVTTAYKDFIKRMDFVIARASGRKATRFKNDIHARYVFEVELGLHQNNGQNLFVVPKTNSIPTSNPQEIGLTQSLISYGRSCSTRAVNYLDLFLGAKETDQEALDIVQDTLEIYQDFLIPGGISSKEIDEEPEESSKEASTSTVKLVDTTATLLSDDESLADIPF
jgi:hypothetical protein